MTCGMTSIYREKKKNIHRPIHQMGFVHATQIKNKSHPHPHLSLLQDLLLFVVNATTCKWWASKASSKQLPSRHNRDFIINRNVNKSNNHVSTVYKKDIIIQLPNLGLHSWHSSQISKRLKSSVYNFYSCVNLKIIFQNTRRIKSFFPYKDRLNRSQQSKVIYKAIVLGL